MRTAISRGRLPFPRVNAQRIPRYVLVGLLPTAIFLAGCDDPTEEISVTGSDVTDRRTTESDEQTVPEGAAEEEQGSSAASLVRTCLEERGFVTRSTENGRWEVDIPSGGEGQVAAEEALSECMEENEPPAPEPFTDEELSGHYDGLLESASCLREQGWEIDPAPSRQVFIETYPPVGGGAVSEAPWSPYLSVPDQMLEVALEECPQPTRSED